MQLNRCCVGFFSIGRQYAEVCVIASTLSKYDLWNGDLFVLGRASVR